MRVLLIVVLVIVCLTYVCTATSSEVENERKQEKHKFLLLERVQREREKEKQKLKLQKEMILKHVKAREREHKEGREGSEKNENKNKALHSIHNKHSLETLSHGSAYASRRAHTKSDLSSTINLSSKIQKHHIKERVSDAVDLKNIERLLLNLDKTKQKAAENLFSAKKTKKSKKE